MWQKNVKADNLFFVDKWELPKSVTHKLHTNFKQWRHNFDKEFYLFQYKVHAKIKTRIKLEFFFQFYSFNTIEKSQNNFSRIQCLSAYSPTAMAT